MKILKIFLGIGAILLISLVIVFIVAGIIIPTERSFTNEVEINAPSERVWQVITDTQKYTEWQDQLAKVEHIDDKNWVEYLKNSPEPLRFSVASDERPSRMEFHYTMGDSFNGHWKGEITPSGSAVKLKTTDSYTAKSWPTKILIYAFFDMESFAKDWNNKLKARVESLDK